MKRTTVMLPEELKARAERRAREERVSLGELIRTSLENVLEQPSSLAEDSLFDDDATWDGPVPADYVTDHDRHLYGDDE